MKIPNYTLKKAGCVPRVSFADFVVRNRLEIEVIERDRSMWAFTGHRYYAHFKDCEFKDGCILTSSSGNANTPEDAIEVYATECAGKLLVISAYGCDRREIHCPNEWAES